MRVPFAGLCIPDVFAFARANQDASGTGPATMPRAGPASSGRGPPE